MAVCGGGVKDLGDGACEIKRMYVIPEARNAGRGRELLVALEDAARELGYERARLDTGPDAARRPAHVPRGGLRADRELQREPDGNVLRGKDTVSPILVAIAGLAILTFRLQGGPSGEPESIGETMEDEATAPTAPVRGEMA